ncbi:hypothetical protein F5Y12DRAFT_215358 [Xylaria sp. FL1777]|nr:hypothetical protein F5Y12DRAFT_215358 [Xylaria sp. FL1777]
MAPPSKTRRTHYKSRKGCRQCKQRHIKCDEQRPTCLQCSMRGLSCMYRYVFVESNDDKASECTVSPASSVVDQSPTSCVVAHSEMRSTTSPAPSLVVQEVIQQTFDLSHLELFHYVANDLMKPSNLQLLANEKDSQDLQKMIVTSALSSPYLMDALLGFAALHLGVVASDLTKQHHYRHQAMNLQTRALALYNAACPEITDQNCTALFLYSSFIGMHMLHETATSRADLLDLLDRFIQFAGLYRGVGTVTNRAWHIIKDSELSSVIRVIEAADGIEQSSESICDELPSLLMAAKDRLGPASFQACDDAVQSLRQVVKQRNVLQAPMCQHIVLAWPVRISTEYLQLLRERQPEALVIMAYWGILLHYERDFWVFGQGGQLLIQAISSYLGAYWDKWMALPREVIKPDSMQKT